MKFRNLVAVALALWAGPVALANANVVIDPTTYVLISSSRVTRDIFDFNYTVAATNTGTTQQNDCIADVTSLSAATVVRDAFVKYPPLAPGASATSADTFTIRQDRNLAFNPNNLVWQVNCTNSNNTQPVAHAGADQTVFAGSLVTLDASSSTDADGDPLTFHWTLISRPAGSTATLSSATAVMPTFVADVAGQYDVELIVSDGTINSVPDLVVISTMPANTPPVANAGPDVNVFLNDLVVLDGTASTDVDGEPLTFSWTIVTAPANSTAALTGANTPQPSFIPDVVGNYTVRLTVSDPHGATSTDDVVVSTQQPNLVPIAEAGEAQIILNKQPVQLRSKDSFDPEGMPITFAWSFVSRPAGSNAVLVDATTDHPSFTPDVAGDYVVQLIVSDGVRFSLPDTVLITSNNAPPVANAGVDQLLTVGSTAHLDGSASSDANNDPLAYFWSLTTRPASSATVLNNAFTPNPTFTVDRPGLYVAQLIVNDGTVDSPPATVSISGDPVLAITMPATVNVRYRQPTSLTVSITRNAATMGPVVLSLSSSNPSVVSITQSGVVIPAGQSSAIFELRGENLGSATLTASASGFPTVTASASVAAALNIFTSGVLPLPGTNQITVTFESPPGNGGTTVGPGGMPVTLVSADPGCISVPANVTIPQFASTVGVTISHGGTTVTPCTTTITASTVAGVASDTESITVRPYDYLTVPASFGVVAGGMQQTVTHTVSLNNWNHGGVTVQLTSSDPSRVLVSPDATTPGGASASMFVPNGRGWASFVVQGANWVTGTSQPGPVTLTASAPNFRPASASAEYRQGTFAFVQSGGVASPTPASANTSWFVQAGYPIGPASIEPQAVRAGSSLSIALTNSNATTAELDPIGGGAGSQSATVVIPSGAVGAMVTSGFEFDPLAGGGTNITAASEGFISRVGSFPVGGNRLALPPSRIGGGLQLQLAVDLNGPHHGGKTVRITSSDPSRILVAPDEFLAGSAFIDVTVPDGVSNAPFVLRGLPWTVGTSTETDVLVTATTPGFFTDSEIYRHVQPALDLIDLPASTTIVSPNTRFRVRVGVPEGDGVSPQMTQSLLTATFTNSFAVVGQLEGQNGSDSAQQRTYTVPPGGSTSPSVGLEFDPIGIGTTTVSATIPGFISTPRASANVQVVFANGPGQLGLPAPSKLGAGLQSEAIMIDLPHGQHGGTSVTVTSSDPNRVRIAPNHSTVGSGSLTLQVPSGSPGVPIVIQGVDWVEGTSSTGTVTLTAHASSVAFSDVTDTIEYEQAYLGLWRLPTQPPDHEPVDASSANVDFQVFAGLVDFTAITFTAQRARPGGITVTLSNDDASVAELDPNGGGLGAQTRMVTIPGGQSYSPLDAAGGVEFDPLGSGWTMVTAESPGFVTLPLVSEQSVFVDP